MPWRGRAAVARANVVFVLTALPTESRAPTNIGLMHRIQALLVEGLERRDPPDTRRLVHLLHLDRRRHRVACRAGGSDHAVEYGVTVAMSVETPVPASSTSATTGSLHRT